MSDHEYYQCPCGRNHPVGVQCAIGRKAGRSFSAPTGSAAAHNPNPRVGVLLRLGGASVRLYNRMNPRFGKRGLKWLQRNWPEARLRRDLPGYGEAVSREWNAILAHRQNAAMSEGAGK